MITGFETPLVACKMVAEYAKKRTVEQQNSLIYHRKRAEKITASSTLILVHQINFSQNHHRQIKFYSFHNVSLIYLGTLVQDARLSFSAIFQGITVVSHCTDSFEFKNIWMHPFEFLEISHIRKCILLNTC